jgi:murein DD-endopeptidase MepM/ murein hydrolase activator NlpD
LPKSYRWRRQALLIGALLAASTTVQGGTAPTIRLITQSSTDDLTGMRVIQAPEHARHRLVRPPLPAVRAPVGTDGFEVGLWPVAGRVSSAYGQRRHPIKKRSLFHHGLDLAAPVGTPIRAVAAGRVSFSGWAGGYGNRVDVDHGAGWTTRYAHAQTRVVQVGQRVQAGETLASVGSTGLSTGPHLHFEIRQDGASHDPARWLDATPKPRLARHASETPREAGS